MVPWLAEVNRIKIIVFTYICGYLCVYMNDEPWVWVFASNKSALCFFLRFWWQRVALMKESRNLFPAARFMTSIETYFWVVDGMTFWPWKKWIEWPKTDLVD